MCKWEVIACSNRLNKIWVYRLNKDVLLNLVLILYIHLIHSETGRIQYIFKPTNLVPNRAT